VYWEDTDAGGVVYYANYLRFLERARTEWLRAMGIEQEPLKRELGILLVVAKAEANYRRPGRYGNLLEVRSRIVELGRVSLIFEQLIYRNDELLMDATTRVGCIDAETFRPRPLPEIIVREIEK
jgi:acyl-CoA thioester hydrolase